MKPFRLEPACKDYLWGGDKLKQSYGKQFEGDILAETWELSAHPDGSSMVTSGEWEGLSFRQVYRDHPEIAGSNGTGKEFPVLIKLIDARQKLSVQVHPDDAYAARVEPGGTALGKTEMWVVLDCEPGASLLCNFRRLPEPGELERRIRDNTLAGLLQQVPVRPGDVIFIPSGTIHAIGEGIVLAEVQQNSNTTYRVFDYGRRDKDGNLRELHVDKALEVIRPGTGLPPSPGRRPPEAVGSSTLERLASCPYFTVDRLQLEGGYEGLAGMESFVSLLCVDGQGTLSAGGEAFPYGKGSSLFLPAGSGEYRLEGSSQLLLTTI